MWAQDEENVGLVKLSRSWAWGGSGQVKSYTSLVGTQDRFLLSGQVQPLKDRAWVYHISPGVILYLRKQSQVPRNRVAEGSCADGGQAAPGSGSSLHICLSSEPRSCSETTEVPWSEAGWDGACFSEQQSEEQFVSKR